MKNFALAITVLVAGCASHEKSASTAPAGSASASSAAAPAAAPKTLYERLGGKPAIVAVVDEFTSRVAADKRINGRFINTDITRLRTLLVEFVCVATGGPCKYEGRDMPSSHGGMQL